MVEELRGRRILVVEDEWLLADEIGYALEAAGATVVGPEAGVADAKELMAASSEPLDAATLNVRVSDGESYPIADELARLGVPFVFASANSATSLPSRCSRSAIVTKPFSGRQVVQALAALLS